MSWNWIAKKPAGYIEPRRIKRKHYSYTFIAICFCVGLLFALALAIPQHDKTAMVSIPTAPIATEPLPPLMPPTPTPSPTVAPPSTAGLPDQHLVLPELKPVVWPDVIPIPQPKPVIIKPKAVEQKRKKTSATIIDPFQD